MKLLSPAPAFQSCQSSLSLKSLLLATLLLTAFNSFAATVWLDDLEISATEQGWGSPGKNKSVEGHPLTIGGQTFAHGLGTHSESFLAVAVNGAASFSATVGVDDEVIRTNGKSPASVEFFVIGDGQTLWQSGVMRAGDQPKSFSAALAGIKLLRLKVGDAGDGTSYDHADWADAKFETTSDRTPQVYVRPPERAVILTPPPSRKPRINSAKVVGVRPGAPFLFHIALTGDPPTIFMANGLPHGLQLDTMTGNITGTVEKPGASIVTLMVKNKQGATVGKLKIICGPQIGLTPAMGWNSWNCFAGAVSQEKVKSAADAMVASGLINHGWTYINIDDYWEVHRDSKDPTLQGPQRDAEGRILPNPRFPDMKGLADYVHGLGLRIGLYSSPGPWTCGGCVASFDHELLDAKQYGDWGFDYLKYDWCSYSPELEKQRGSSSLDLNAFKSWSASQPEDLQKLAKPYAIMRSALDEVHRDILFSFCQYGMGNVWEWGADIGGNSWRTTGDITDTWSSMSGIGFKQNGHEKFAGPGHFNDPDMLVVGKVGWGNLHPTHLTPNEQYTHISLWCLLSAPLLIGCDMTQLDDFTKSLLSNDEVIEVDQDPLGHQASRITVLGDTQVWAKDMEDGSKAVGLFNLGDDPAPVQVNWADLGLDGRHAVRDLWRQKDLGKFRGKYGAEVPRHGVVLIRVK